MSLTIVPESPNVNDPASDWRNPFRVVVLSGPSGSGKTTVVERLMTKSPVPLMKAVSATTRAPRIGEIEGTSYYFLSDDVFQSRRRDDEFLETAEVFGAGYWYGTLRSELDRARSLHAWALLEIDVEGAQKIVSQFPDAITIFLRTSSEDVFEQRLRDRGTESEETIRRRLDRARSELAAAGWYKHQVINDDLDTAVEQICRILTIEKDAGHA